MKYFSLAPVVVGTMLAAAMNAATSQTPAGVPARMNAPELQSANAVRAVRDQSTGKLRRATQAELAELFALEKAERAARGLPENTADAPVTVRQHLNGMVSAELSAEHLVSVKGQRRADGQLLRSHVHPSLEHPTAPAAKQRPTE